MIGSQATSLITAARTDESHVVAHVRQYLQDGGICFASQADGTPRTPDQIGAVATDMLVNKRGVRQACMAVFGIPYTKPKREAIDITQPPIGAKTEMACQQG